MKNTATIYGNNSLAKNISHDILQDTLEIKSINYHCIRRLQITNCVNPTNKVFATGFRMFDHAHVCRGSNE